MNGSVYQRITEPLRKCLVQARDRGARYEAHIIQWLSARGMSTQAAKFWVLIGKVVLIGAAIYAAFWLVLLLALVFLIVGGFNGLKLDGQESAEWRDGHSGFGLYDKNEWRHDMNDADS